MASINHRLASSVLNLFTHSTRMSRAYAADRGNIVNSSKYLTFPIANSFEIPIAFKSDVESKLWDIYGNEDTPNHDIVYNISISSAVLSYRSSDPILNKLFERGRTEFLKIATNKGLSYIGARGIVLDKDYLPLMFVTISGDTSYEGGWYRLNYTKATVYIHPVVFVRDSDLICKAIIKKIIPYLVAGLPKPLYSVLPSGVEVSYSPDFKVELKIEDVSFRFFLNPDISYIQEEGVNLEVPNFSDYLETVN